LGIEKGWRVSIPASSASNGTQAKPTRKGAEVPGRSSREDRAEGTMDKAKGRVKEAGGALTGDKSKKSEGRADQRKGKAKQKSAAAKDLAK
jgi:uncharacterized protein YjbJ (UPF0337 family)